MCRKVFSYWFPREVSNEMSFTNKPFSISLKTREKIFKKKKKNLSNIFEHEHSSVFKFPIENIATIKVLSIVRFDKWLKREKLSDVRWIAIWLHETFFNESRNLLSFSREIFSYYLEWETNEKKLKAKIEVAQLKKINIDIRYVIIMIRSDLHSPNRLMNKL